MTTNKLSGGDGNSRQAPSSTLIAAAASLLSPLLSHVGLPPIPSDYCHADPSPLVCRYSEPQDSKTDAPQPVPGKQSIRQEPKDNEKSLLDKKTFEVSLNVPPANSPVASPTTPQKVEEDKTKGLTLNLSVEAPKDAIPYTPLSGKGFIFSDGVRLRLRLVAGGAEEEYRTISGVALDKGSNVSTLTATPAAATKDQLHTFSVTKFAEESKEGAKINGSLGIFSLQEFKVGEKTMTLVVEWNKQLTVAPTVTSSTTKDQSQSKKEAAEAEMKIRETAKTVTIKPASNNG